MQSRMIVQSPYFNRRFLFKVVPMRFVKEIHEIGKFSLLKVFKMFTLALRLMWNLIFFRPQLVYYSPTHRGYSFYRDWLYVMIIKFFRRPIVFHQHNKGGYGPESTALQRRLRRMMYRRTDSMVLSPLLIYDIEEYCDPGRIHVVPNGMPDSPAPCPPGDSQVPTVLFLSNLIAEKGVWILMEALASLKRKGVDFKAVYAGHISYNVTEEDFQRRLRQLDLQDCVQWIGFVSGPHKQETICNCDIMAFPTFMKHETFGNVVVEAMRASRPVVASTEGSLPFIIEDGVTGFICRKKDVDDLADKLERLLLDTHLRSRMGAAARKRFEERFTFSRFEENFAAVLEKILDIPSSK
jgi:glycosyltransferase involved in cell wall biosynthesis